MSIEHARSYSSSQHVTKRLCATIVCFVGIICIMGGYLLGRMAKNEVRRSNDIISFNLTVAAEKLYKKARRISPKALHQKDSDIVAIKLLDVFHCDVTECGTIHNLNLPGFVRNCLNHKVDKLLKFINNATVYVDSLR